MQAELEVRDDSEVAASAAQSPEQVGVLVGCGPHERAVSGDDLERLDVVTGQTVLAGEPAVAAAEGEAADAGVRDVAGGDGETVSLGGAIQSPEQRTALNARPHGRGIHGDLGEVAEVEHQPTVRNAVPHGGMAAAPDAQFHVAVPSDLHGTSDVFDRRGADDDRRAVVDDGVPHPPGVVIAHVAGFEVRDIVETINHLCASRLSRTSPASAACRLRHRLSPRATISRCAVLRSASSPAENRPIS